MTPDRKVGRLTIDFECDTQEVFEAAVERPRIGLDVEEDVPWRWLWEGRQAAPGDVRLGRDEFEDPLMGHALMELESRLVAEPSQRA